MRNWFKFQASTEDASTVDIHIIDFIGSWDDDWLARNWGYEMGVTAKAFIASLAALPETVKNLKVHINSPGGDIQGGVNIANALREQQMSKGRNVETFIDGIAASIASVIAMAGSKVHIGDNALVMVHNPYTIAIGNAGEMRKTADVLDTMRNQIIATYKWHSSLDDKALAKLMDAETWMDADEAIANGLATDKVVGLKAAASINRAAAKLAVPDKYRARVDALLSPAPAAKAPAAAADVLRVCREHECLDLAEGLLAAGATLEDVTSQAAVAKAARAQAATRIREIRALCASANQPELADGYIAGAMAIDDVRKHLTVITAKQDKVEIDANLKPGNGQDRDTQSSWKDAFARLKRGFGTAAK